jgi:hypothetical protein
MNLAAILVMSWAAAPLGAEPPTRARRSNNDWQLDIVFQDPQRLLLEVPGERGAAVYWYVLYEVTNRTGADREFYPSFRLVTDTLQVVEGGAFINPAVYDLIIQRHRGEFPFLAPPTAATGLLLQGEANARSSVAVFRDFDPKANRFTIFVSGLSGVIERMANPVFRPTEPESEENPRFFIMRKALSIAYDLPGDPATRDQATPIRRSREWVMR